MEVCSDNKFREILDRRFHDNRPVPHVDVQYLHNHVFLKKYDDDNGNVKYRLVYMPVVKDGRYEYGQDLVDRQERNMLVKAVTRGYDPENPFIIDDDIKYYIHDVKFDSSLIRAKNKIFDLAFCNDWEFFFTGTLSDKKVRDRSDLPYLHKKLSQFVKDYNKIHHAKVKFLIVPELHADGVNWHFHGFLMGFGGVPDSFRKLQLENFLPLRVKSEIQKGFDVYSWKQYEKSFGWNYIEAIKDHESVAKYCTKYITKEMLSNVSEVGAHLYYRSRGLRRPEVIARGHVPGAFVNSIIWDSENEYCKIKEVEEGDLDNYISVIDRNSKQW